MTAEASNRFELSPDVITLLRASNVDHRLSDMEYGAAWIDPKRPYGNSDVETDIAEQLGWAVGRDGLSQDERDQARELHAQTPTALQIVLSVGFFEPGIYERTRSYGRDWNLVKPTRGYVRFTERNEHEGETWYTYIATHGNGDALTALAEIVTACNAYGQEDYEPDEDSDQYVLDLDSPLPAHVVAILEAYDPDECGYMSRHCISAGVLTIPEGALAAAREGNDPLYKSIRDWIK